MAEQLGCAFNEGPMGPYVRTDASKMTTVPGVYAAGNLTLMRHNAARASAEGVLTCTEAHQALVFGVVTTKSDQHSSPGVVAPPCRTACNACGGAPSQGAASLSRVSRTKNLLKATCATVIAAQPSSNAQYQAAPWNKSG